MSNLFVSAVIKANPDKDLDLVRNELKKMISETQKEVGCFKFEGYEDNSEKGVFTLWEEFADPEALAQHFREPHTVAYINQKLTSVVTANYTSSL